MSRLALCNVRGPLTDLLEKLSGEDGDQWLRALNKMLRRENPWEPKIFPINRDQPFDSEKFLGRGWTINEQDERSLYITQLDLNEVRLEHMLRKDEDVIKGEEKLRRLKEAGHIRLDAGIFQAFRKNQVLIPRSWIGNFVYFDGTILRSPTGNRCVLFLFWRDGQWDWGYFWLEQDWTTGSSSAVLPAT